MDTLLTFGLISSLVVAVTAMHLHLTARPLEPAPVRLMGDIDAEFFRIMECEGLRDAWPVP